MNLARVYVMLDRYDAALPELDEALSMEPDYEPARKILRSIQAKLN